MKNDHSLNMGSSMDAIFNQIFSAPDTSSQNKKTAGGTNNVLRNKKDFIRLNVRSQTGGTNLVTIAKDTPVFTSKEINDLALCDHDNLRAIIIDYGTHRVLKTKTNHNEFALERLIIQ